MAAKTQSHTTYERGMTVAMLREILRDVPDEAEVIMVAPDEIEECVVDVMYSFDDNCLLMLAESCADLPGADDDDSDKEDKPPPVDVAPPKDPEPVHKEPYKVDLPPEFDPAFVEVI